MKLISLLSGGIDSAVSSYMLLRKGAEVIFVHFHNQTIQKKHVENKVVKIAQILAKFSKKETKLYLVPFKEVQHEIIKTVPADVRMIVYRRIMFRIADEILEKEGAKALITGDNIGQVASQTLDNIKVIHSAAKHTVLTPLLGMDKVDIIKKAQEIGTYEASILPYSDCCSYLIAKHPQTKSKLKEIEEIEAKANLTEQIKKAIKEARIIPLP
ncbi:MAG: 7-cyano-7-deazaguanine synthase [Candidatus Woesearchaeota archaeon]